LFVLACCLPIGAASAKSTAASESAEIESRMERSEIRDNARYDLNPGASCPVRATYSV
jgi:hypothetical protein